MELTQVKRSGEPARVYQLTPDERADLVAYVDGELPENHARTIATKLTKSATARREVEMLQKTWELLDLLPRPQVTEHFSEKTVSEIRRLELKTSTWEPHRRRVGRLVGAIDDLHRHRRSVSGIRLRHEPLGVAGSNRTYGARLDAGRTPRRVFRGWLIRILEPTDGIARIWIGCSLKRDRAGIGGGACGHSRFGRTCARVQVLDSIVIGSADWQFDEFGHQTPNSRSVGFGSPLRRGDDPDRSRRRSGEELGSTARLATQ